VAGASAADAGGAESMQLALRLARAAPAPGADPGPNPMQGPNPLLRQGAIVAVEDAQRRLFGLQYHPEVMHSERGTATLRNFLFGIAGVAADWQIESVLAEELEKLRQTARAPRRARAPCQAWVPQEPAAWGALTCSAGGCARIPAPQWTAYATICGGPRPLWSPACFARHAMLQPVSRTLTCGAPHPALFSDDITRQGTTILRSAANSRAPWGLMQAMQVTRAERARARLYQVTSIPPARACPHQGSRMIRLGLG